MMTSVIKKCPKCGVVHDVSFEGTCESCFSPLQYYCRIHGDWLVDDTCSRCTPSMPAPAPTPAPKPTPKPAPKPAPPPPAPVPAPAPAPAPASAKSSFLQSLVIAVTTATVVALVTVVGLKLVLKPSAPAATPAATIPATPAPPTPTPATTTTTQPRPPTPRPTVAPPAPRPTPINKEISLVDLLRDPDLYLGRSVTVTARVQIKEAEKSSMDIGVGESTLQVKYRDLSAAEKARLADVDLGKEVTATGTLGYNADFNTYYISATQVVVR